jgi:wee1-like protein kinase
LRRHVKLPSKSIFLESCCTFVFPDSRYLPLELLNVSADRDLTKCDIFSLGCTVYEVLLGEELPVNGSDWIAMREGKLRIGEIEALPTELENLVQTMLQVNIFSLLCGKGVS